MKNVKLSCLLIPSDDKSLEIKCNFLSTSLVWFKLEGSYFESVIENHAFPKSESVI